MNKDNIACVQKVKFIFDFYEDRLFPPGKESPVEQLTDVNKVSPLSVRNFKEFFAQRLERVAGMMEALLLLEGSWAVKGTKDKIVMETSIVDFNDALAMLKDRGYNDNEFILKVEYERKWGLL